MQVIIFHKQIPCYNRRMEIIAQHAFYWMQAEIPCKLV